MRRIKEVKWKRKCVMCDNINSAWVEITVEKDGPDKHIVCEPCLTKVLSFEHWGIDVHRISKKRTFPKWIVNKINEYDKKN